MKTVSPGETSRSAPWIEFIRHPSILVYLILMNVILLCLLFPTLIFLFLQKEEAFRDAQLDRIIRQMKSSLESRSASLAGSIALSSAQAIAGYDFGTLNAMVEQVVSNDPEIVYCIIMNKNRQALVHSFPEKVGGVLDGKMDYQAADVMERHFPPSSSGVRYNGLIRFLYVAGETEQGIDPVFMEAIAPIYSGANLWGVLRFGYSDARLREETHMAKQEWEEKMGQFTVFFLSMTAVFFSIGVAVAVLFTRALIRPMHVLNEGVRRISEGDLSHRIMQTGLACREYIRLTGAFNSMTGKLRDSYEQLSDYSKSLEQKVEERTRELREAQASLVEKAHVSGMAEMAVDILHNIGNAITPAKIDAELMQRHLEESIFRTRFNDILKPIREFVDNADPACSPGREKLVKLIDMLPAGLAKEYDTMLEKLERVVEKHHHIEEIILLQMRYARLSGESEPVEINKLIDDALGMLHDAIGKRSIAVVKEFSNVPPVRIEKSKMMQIFINIIKNGYEAMEGVPAETRKLVIRTSLEAGQPAMVAIAFMDTGVGFAPEDHKKLFQFGYTTKSRGSGFGLHSCANFVKAHDGSLNALSEGRGKGAAFSIKLPACQK